MRLSAFGVTLAMYRCSCDLCSLPFNGKWEVDFPATLNLRPDLNDIAPGFSPGFSAVYASPSLETEPQFRERLHQAGWMTLTVSCDKGLNTRDVVICPTCQMEYAKARGEA